MDKEKALKVVNDLEYCMDGYYSSTDFSKEIYALTRDIIYKNDLLDYLYDTIPSLYDLVATFNNSREYVE